MERPLAHVPTLQGSSITFQANTYCLHPSHMTAFLSQVPVSEADHCHVIYEDRNKYREYVCSLRDPKVNTRQENQQSTDHVNKDLHSSHPA